MKVLLIVLMTYAGGGGGIDLTMQKFSYLNDCKKAEKVIIEMFAYNKGFGTLTTRCVGLVE